MGTNPTRCIKAFEQGLKVLLSICLSPSAPSTNQSRCFRYSCSKRVILAEKEKHAKLYKMKKRKCCWRPREQENLECLVNDHSSNPSSHQGAEINSCCPLCLQATEDGQFHGAAVAKVAAETAKASNALFTLLHNDFCCCRNKLAGLPY